MRNYDDSNCSAVDDMFKRLCFDDQDTSQPNTETQVDNDNNQPESAVSYSAPASEPLSVDAAGTPNPNRQPYPAKPDRSADNVAAAGTTAKKRNYYEDFSSDTDYKKERDELPASSSSSAPHLPPVSQTVRIGYIPDGVTVDKILDLIIAGDIESAHLDLEKHFANTHSCALKQPLLSLTTMQDRDWGSWIGCSRSPWCRLRLSLPKSLKRSSAPVLLVLLPLTIGPYHPP